ncbi:predicted protein [Plenodomus lingam JN3]|uniref:Predicted protein n=2 Tax=Leptosphaeria maculans TaxID=5022 RepID=E4ZK58_LEPMJ|nr:predicted protein [Plenodomus lingam JN3]CBX91653.1 predicted protein [Plenodomus lingam JN3]
MTDPEAKKSEIPKGDWEGRHDTVPSLTECFHTGRRRQIHSQDMAHDGLRMILYRNSLWWKRVSLPVLAFFTGHGASKTQQVCSKRKITCVVDE